MFQGGAADLALGGGQGDGGEAAAAGQEDQNTGFCSILDHLGVMGLFFKLCFSLVKYIYILN